MIILYIIVILERCFHSAVFDIFLFVGILWFIISGIVYKRMKDEEKKAVLQTLKTIFCITFWVGLVVIGAIVNIIAGPITLM